MDPERLLWRPGAKTIFLPAETSIGETIRIAFPPKWTVEGPGVLKVGDVFTIAGNYSPNPRWREYKEYVITAVVESNG